ncbi:hypothetical protein GCM10010129_69170 [Streptomyces fumigatiscleroticus]|nr:hypothetical protein GCM10010129_69170 [Streptomyces fumigatiscleroticus]
MARARAEHQAGVVHVVRGGKRLARARHHLPDAGPTAAGRCRRWEAERWSSQADGEADKPGGDETIRVRSRGAASPEPPAAPAHLANAPHGRYVLTARARFAHRGDEWADRVTANRAVVYRIPHDHDVARGRRYPTASWQFRPAQAVTLEPAAAAGVGWT